MNSEWQQAALPSGDRAKPELSCPTADAAEDAAMTVTAERRTASDRMTCAVRCPGSNEVLGYVVVGGWAHSLEKALEDNGLWLVPVRPRPIEHSQAHEAA